MIAAPFNGYLSAAVDRYLENIQEPGIGTWRNVPGEIITAIINESGKLLYFLMWAIPLLLLFIIPVVNFAAPLIWLLFSSWLISLEYMDYPMSNQGLKFSEIRARLYPHRSICMGFGLATLGMTMVPFINFLAMPVAVISATRLCHDEIKQHVIE